MRKQSDVIGHISPVIEQGGYTDKGWNIMLAIVGIFGLIFWTWLAWRLFR
jgi:hypothetical protein